MPGSEFELRTDDSQSLLARRWLPEGRPRAIVQIAHGLAEHSARYARLAAALNAAGYAVYANDHRGHGPKAAPADLGHFADDGGWGKVVGDLWTMNRLIAKEQPGVPIVFLGHSLGSFLGQEFVAEHSDALAGVVYSGSSGKPPAIATPGGSIARAERLRHGKRGKSELLSQLMFGAFNKPFAPARTEFDWLSRDERKSTPMSPIRSAASRHRPARHRRPRRAARPRHAGAPRAHPQGPADLCLFRRARSGRGQHPGPHRGAEERRLHQADDPIYPGARHETLNETNRDEVTRDLIAWLDGVVGK